MRLTLLIPALALAACASSPAKPAPAPAAPAAGPSASLVLPGERHLANVRQLSFGGENAEAYWSFDGKLLIFQATRDGAPCDQQYVMNADGSGVHRVSSGKGRTTCGYFFPGGSGSSTPRPMRRATPARPSPT